MLVKYWVAAQLVASRVVLSSTELVIIYSLYMDLTENTATNISLAAVRNYAKALLLMRAYEAVA
jgi:hypothetical protein